MNIAAVAVFVMGLRHGADPDHLAAIDNLTRNASERMPYASRFIGALFAIGHSAMVILIASLAAAGGTRLGSVRSGFERAGAIASVVILVVIGVANIATLMHGRTVTLRAKLLPKVLANATHPLSAIPTGAVFGLGFETSSQLAAYGVAFSSAYWLQGLVVGLAFCAGMICTDTIDSLFLARMLAGNANKAVRARQVWIAAVTLVAFGVAAQELAALLGWDTVLNETATTAVIIVLLAGTAMLLARTNASSEKRGAAS